MPGRRGIIRLTVDIPHCPLAAGEIGGSDPVVTTLVHHQTAAGGRIGVVVIELIETIPPIEMVFGEIGFTDFTGGRPGAGHQQVAFHRGHGAMGPAGSALLAFYRGYIVQATDITQIISRRQYIPLGNKRHNDKKRCPPYKSQYLHASSKACLGYASFPLSLTFKDKTSLWL